MKIEEYIEADKSKVIGLMREIFSSERMRKAAYFDEEHWRWQYQDNPYGRAVTMLAKDGDDIVGQYANVPVNIKFSGTTLISSVTIDLMVKRPYRRQGLFRKMADAASDKLLASGIALSFAFPSRAESYSGFVDKLGWRRIGDLKLLAKLIFPKPMKKKSSLDYIRVEKIEDFPDEVDTVWERMKPLIKIGVVRKREYLSWRYFKNPKADYEVYMAWRNNMPAGYCVLRTMRFSGIKVGVIVDMLCVDSLDVITALLNKAEGYFLRNGAFVCIIVKTKLYENLLREAGFKALPERLSPKSWTLIARPNVDTMDLASLVDIDRWFLSFGDWDVV